MTKKQNGKCPFCNGTVQAEIVKKYTVRRDKCQCPKCNEAIYVCRTPGCHDYAKGTDSYDQELCPDCTSKIVGVATVATKAALTTATAIAETIASAWAKKKFSIKDK